MARHRSTASELLLAAALTLAGCSSALEERDGGGDGRDGGGDGRDGGSGGALPITPGAGGAVDGGSTSDGGDLALSPILFSPLGEPVLDLADGGDAPLYAAPQGGHVLRLGARIAGLGNAPDYLVRITSRIRRLDTNAIVAEDSRTAVTAEDPERPGARISDRRTDSQFSHAALCPAYGRLDVVDVPYLLEVEVEELYSDQTTGRATLSIVPRCTAGTEAEQATCRCECEREYVLGRCSSDAAGLAP